MAVESKSNDCLETMSLRKSRLGSPLSSSRLVMLILMQSRTKTVHEKSICIQKLLSLFSLMLSSFTTPSSESSLSYMSSLLHPSRLCFTDPVDLRFYFFLNPISSTSAQSLIQIVDLSCFFIISGQRCTHMATNHRVKCIYVLSFLEKLLQLLGIWPYHGRSPHVEIGRRDCILCRMR